jgi:uncharacterized protein YdhG (YjbR/CyaY superfamily)
MSKDKRVDDYIATFPPKTRTALRKVRAALRKAAPAAEETISYRIPALRGNGMLVYFAGFKNHIGMFPPVRGDARLLAALARYQGPKGNLRFPLTEPMPVSLITRIAKRRVKQDREKAAARTQRKRRSPAARRLRAS